MYMANPDCIWLFMAICALTFKMIDPLVFAAEISHQNYLCSEMLSRSLGTRFRFARFIGFPNSFLPLNNFSYKGSSQLRESIGETEFHN